MKANARFSTPLEMTARLDFEAITTISIES